MNLRRFSTSMIPFAMVLASHVVACSSDGDTEAPPLAVGSCGDLEQLAELVPVVRRAEEPPPPTGGVLSDGEFVLVSDVLYMGSNGAEGPTGEKNQTTVRIDGSRMVSKISSKPARSVRFTTAGVTLTTSDPCPESLSVGTQEYSATSTELRVFQTLSDGVEVATFQKR